jgi:hypothetical protein
MPGVATPYTQSNGSTTKISLLVADQLTVEKNLPFRRTYTELDT